MVVNEKRTQTGLRPQVAVLSSADTVTQFLPAGKNLIHIRFFALQPQFHCEIDLKKKKKRKEVRNKTSRV
jgi:hypothetical protein